VVKAWGQRRLCSGKRNFWAKLESLSKRGIVGGLVLSLLDIIELPAIFRDAISDSRKGGRKLLYAEG
jgi:hypothetical protein